MAVVSELRVLTVRKLPRRDFNVYLRREQVPLHTAVFTLRFDRAVLRASKEKLRDEMQTRATSSVPWWPGSSTICALWTPPSCTCILRRCNVASQWSVRTQAAPSMLRCDKATQTAETARCQSNTLVPARRSKKQLYTGCCNKREKEKERERETDKHVERVSEKRQSNK